MKKNPITTEPTEDHKQLNLERCTVSCKVLAELHTLRDVQMHAAVAVIGFKGRVHVERVSNQLYISMHRVAWSMDLIPGPHVSKRCQEMHGKTFEPRMCI